MINHNPQSSSNPWMSWAFALNLPNSGYRPSHSTELLQLMDVLAVCPNLNINLDIISHKSTNPQISWVFALT
jgi:hypothetical protein